MSLSCDLVSSLSVLCFFSPIFPELKLDSKTRNNVWFPQNTSLFQHVTSRLLKKTPTQFYLSVETENKQANVSSKDKNRFFYRTYPNWRGVVADAYAGLHHGGYGLSTSLSDCLKNPWEMMSVFQKMIVLDWQLDGKLQKLQIVIRRRKGDLLFPSLFLKQLFKSRILILKKKIS